MNHKNFLICFFFFIVKINDNFVFSYITLPFYYENKAQNNPDFTISSPKEYFEQMLNLSTYTNININNKIIKFHLTFERFASYISEKDFNETSENEENIEQNIYSLDYIGISFADYQKNIFHFITNYKKDVTIKNYTFFVVKSMKKATDYEIYSNAYATEKNEIGFNIVKGRKFYNVDVGGYEQYFEKYILKNGGYNVEDKTNLINQLKSNNIISSYSFTIKIDSKNDLNGNIIIGGYPHELDPKHYKEDFLIYDESNFQLYYYFWNYLFEDIAYGNKKLDWAKNVEFSFEFPFILSNWNYLKYLDEQFFKNEKYNDSCFQDKVEGYYIKYCSKDVIKDFKSIYFYLSNHYIKENQINYIKFDYQDLFIKSTFDDNIYLFQMVFSDSSYKWILGKPFFKKYTTVFDQDKKIFGIYTESGEYDLDEKDEEPNIFKNWFYLLLMFASVFFIFSVILITIFCKKYPFNKRKIKANELDDDYDYNTKDIDRNQNDLLINE